jgi:gliding motility-associated-like protein
MKRTLLILSFFICTNCLAQKQANIWYFGNNLGLDFNFSPPKLLTDGQVTWYSSDVAAESSSVASDEDGKLLFYSNGVTIWNKNHQVMPNGSGLLGHNSTTQTLIVPQPGSNTIFYVFTASPQGAGESCDQEYLAKPGFRFSIVDLSKENGLGDVTEKNMLLTSSTTEKIAATIHRNGKDIWIVMHEVGTNIFHAYLLSARGLDRYPILSSAGNINDSEECEKDSQGQLKFSPDGKKLAKVMRRSSIVELFDFDKSTGVVSPWTFINGFSVPYGVEFSKSRKYLYVSDGLLYQFDLTAKNIQQSQVILNENEVPALVADQLQLAPDGKIYVAHYADYFVGSINYPDSIGHSCNYDNMNVALPPNFICNLGLPNFLSSYFYDSALYPADTVLPSPLFDMPNVFTPNGDGLNERFVPLLYYYVKSSELKIYNRWGKEVFQTNDLLSGWNGGDHPAGTYYWQVNYIGMNGEVGHQRGWVQLIR